MDFDPIAFALLCESAEAITILAVPTIDVIKKRCEHIAALEKDKDAMAYDCVWSGLDDMARQDRVVATAVVLNLFIAGEWDELSDEILPLAQCPLVPRPAISDTVSPILATEFLKYMRGRSKHLTLASFVASQSLIYLQNVPR